MKRRNFIHNSTKAGIALSLLGVYGCKDGNKKESKTNTVSEDVAAGAFFKLSLAQWSINRMIREEGLNPYRFAEKAKSWGFEGLEYVSQLYKPELEAANYSKEAMKDFVDKNNAEAEKYGLTNVLIMIDSEGDLSVSEKTERDAAIKSHSKWVDAAAAMGCSSVRVNLFGGDAEKDPKVWHDNSVDGMGRLAAYAANKNVNVIVENHGGLSSDAAKVVAVIKEINMPNCGVLPDFGNFCVKRDSGERWGGNCIEQYDIYKGVAEMMPYAKGVSAKAFDFDGNGHETTIDFFRIMQLVKDAGYNGFVGVEYEGDELGEEEGILATKNLLLKVADELAQA